MAILADASTPNLARSGRLEAHPLGFGLAASLHDGLHDAVQRM